MKTPLTYNEAYTELERLVHELEDDGIQLDALAEKVVQANELIRICEEKLRKIEGDVNEKLRR